MKNGISSVIVVLIVVSLLIGATAIGYFGNDLISKNFSSERQKDQNAETKNITDNNADKNDGDSSKEPDFCKEYGTFEVKKSDLLKTHEVGPGETLRSIAKIALNDEARATDIISVNSQLSIYEIDDELPYKQKVFIPNDRYNEEGITTYIKARGNIQYNEEKPMFGINAPNSGTGPFIISDKIKSDVEKIKEGDCVEAVYGSKGYDPQKVVLEIKLQ